MLNKVEQIIRNYISRKVITRLLTVVILAVFFSGLLFISIQNVSAAPGIRQTINFQGKLVNDQGLNVSDSTYSVVFTLYDAPSGGTQLWQETRSVSTSDGIFREELGTDTSLSSVDFDSDSIYLGIKVGSDAEMTPRVRFTATPYAFQARSVAWSGLTDAAANLAVSMGSYTTAFTYGNNTGANDLFKLTDTSSNTGTGRILSVQSASGSTVKPLHVSAGGAEAILVDANGNVGIGTTNPTRKLDVNGTMRIRGQVYDYNNEVGTPGQVLSTTATGVDWIDASGVGTDNQTLANVYSQAGNNVQLTGAYGDIRFYRGASTEMLFLDESSGNIGIGTTNPTYKLSVNGDVQIVNGSDLYSFGSVTLGNRSYTTPTYVASGQTFTASIQALDNAVESVVSGSGGVWNRNVGSGYLFPATLSDSVGIGTSTPTAKLQVVGNIVGSTLSDGTVTITGGVISNATTIRTGNGSAASPSFSFTSDTNTGFYRAASDSIGIGTSGVERVRVSSSGNVGIGTTNPGYKLDVAGDLRIVNGSDLYSFGSATLGNRSYTTPTYVASGQTFTASIQALDDAVESVVAGSGGVWSRDSGSGYLFPQTLTDSVGIGTSTPSEKLHVVGNILATGNIVGSTLSDGTISITNGNITGAGNITAGGIITGTGSGLTGLNASNLASGTVPSARISGNYSGITGVGTITSGTWQGSVISSTYLDPAVILSTEIDTYTELNTIVSDVTLTHNGLIDTSAEIAGIVGDETGSGALVFANSPTFTGNVLFPGSGTWNSSGNVGIGTTNPLGKAHIYSASSGVVTPNSAWDNLVIEDSSFAGLSILTGTSGQGALVFGDSDLSAVGQVRYNHSTNSMSFYTTGTEKLTITSSGQLGIGTTNPGYKLSVNGDIEIANGSELYSFGSATLGNRTYSTPTYVSSGQTFTASIQALDNAVESVVAGSGGVWTRDSGSGYLFPQTLTDSVGIGTSVPSEKLHVVGNAIISGNITSGGIITGTGSGLTGLNASNLASGTVPSARISGNYSGITGVGTITSGTWQGSVISSTYLDPAVILSTEIDTYTELNTIVSDVTLTHNGLIDTSAEIAGIVGDETGSGALVFANSPVLVTPNIGAATGTSLNVTGAITSGGIITGTGSGLTALNASNLTTGTVPNGRIAGAYTNFTNVTGTGNAQFANFRAGDGTRSAPSYSFTSDTNTGMYRIGNDILSFATAGADRFSILAGGNVGVGNTNPTYKLSVNGDVEIANGSELYSFGSATLGNRTYSTPTYVASGQTFTASIQALDNAVESVVSGSGGVWTRNSGSGYLFPATLSDNVGIGTSVPSEKLHVLGNAIISGNITSGGIITGTGSGLTGLNASNLASGTVPSARISGNYAGITGVGTITSGTWQGSVINSTYLDPAVILSTEIDTYNELNTIVSDVTLTHNGLIDTYSELNTIVSDVTLTHNGLIDTSAEIAGIVGDETGSGSLVFANTPTLVTPNIGAATGTSLNVTGAITAGGIITGTGSGLTGLNASNLASGTVPDARITGAYTGFTNITGSGTVQFGTFSADNGSRTAPSYTFTSDTNTGMYRIGTDILSLATAGADRFTILAGGNVGVGTTNPSAKLEVNGQVKITGGSPGSNKVLTSDSSGLATWQTLTAASIGDDSLDFDKFKDVMTLDANTSVDQNGYNFGFFGTGNVGIGTSDPSQKLDVNGNALISSNLYIGTTDVQLSRGAANRLDLATGDSFNIVSGNLQIAGTTAIDSSRNANFASSVTLGGDVVASRGAANRLDLASGDSFNIVSGNLQIAGTTAIDSSRNADFATSVTLGGDVVASRGAANRLDLASGDSLNLVSGDLQVGGTSVITSGRLVQTANGSRTAPAYSFSSDTNTGMYRIGTDILSLATAGADRFTILANGSIGIGRTNPSFRLDVAGDARVNALNIGSRYYSNNIYNYTNGILIATDIATSDNRMIEFVIEGNSYSSDGPIETKIQAYNYTGTGTIIQTSGIAEGPISNVDVFHYNGYVYFWLEQSSSFQTMRFQLRTHSGTHTITSITDAAKPVSGVTNSVTITPMKAWYAGNDGATSGLDADLFDSLNSDQFLRSDTSDNFTSGTLAMNGGTTLDVNGDLSIADTSIAFDGASTNFATTGNFSINTNQFFINQSTGNIALGSTNTDSKLTLTGGNIAVKQGSNNTWFLGEDGSSNDRFRILYNTNANTQLQVDNGSGGWVDGITLERGALGYVGIGTTNPSAQLEVGGQIKITGGSPGENKVLISDATGLASWTTIGEASITNDSLDFDKFRDNMTLDNTTTIDLAGYNLGIHGTGNVGIGTSNPSQPLEVAGNALFTTNIYVGTTDVQLSRGAANRLDLASGDSFNIVSGNLQMGATTMITSGRLVQAANGSRTAPAYSFSADTNTGMYRIGTDILGLATAGVDRLTILANGSVGIGTTSPNAKLDVNGTFEFGTSRLLQYNDDNDGITKQGSAGGWAFGLIGAKGDAGADLGGFGAYGSANALNRFYIGEYSTNELVSIEAGGDVGIGNVNPATRLDVSGYLGFTPSNVASFVGTGSEGILLNNGNDIEWLGSTYGSGYGHRLYSIDPGFGNKTDLRIARRNSSGTWTDQVTFESSGNVGIGTTDPAYTLDITGTLRTTGDYALDGNDLIFGNGASISNATDTDLNINGDGDIFMRGNGSGSYFQIAPADGGASNTHFFYGANDDIYLSYGTGGNVYMRSGANTKFTLDSSGNMTLAGNIDIGDNNLTGDIAVDDTRSVNTAPTGYDKEVSFDFKYRSTLDSAPGSGTYGGLMTFAPWGDDSGDASHQLFFNEGGIFWRQGQPNSASWGSWGEVWTGNTDGTGSGLDADTIDGLDSTAFIRDYEPGNWEVSSSTNDDVYTAAALEVREYNHAGAGTGALTEAPRISFHWGGRVASQIGVDTAGVIRTFDNPGTGYEDFAAANITSNGNISLSGAIYDSTDSIVNIAEPLTVDVGTYNIMLQQRNSWGNGGTQYPVIGGNNANEWVMLHNPHIPYLQNGVAGYTGTTTGSIVRFASNTNAAASWDVGIDSDLGTDTFGISRGTSNFLNIASNGTVTIPGLMVSDNLGVIYHNDDLRTDQVADDIRFTFPTVGATTTGSFGTYLLSWSNRAQTASYILNVKKQYNSTFSVSMTKAGGNGDAGFDTEVNNTTNLQLLFKQNISSATHQSGSASFTVTVLEEVSSGRRPSFTVVPRAGGWTSPALPDNYLGSGNVGVGTNSPALKLDVRPANGSASVRIGGHTIGANSGNDYPRIYLGGASSSVAGVFNRLTSSASMYFGESGDTGDYYFRGGDLNITDGNIYGKSANGAYSSLYRMGGVYFTWDSDSYGTNTHHSIRSTYGDTYGDDLTMNSFGTIRLNIDSNSNGSDVFQIGHATTGTANALLTLNESGTLSVNGNILQTAANGQLGASANFVFRDTGDTWLRLRTGNGSSTYADLAVNNMHVNGNLQGGGGTVNISGNAQTTGHVYVGGTSYYFSSAGLVNAAHLRATSYLQVGSTANRGFYYYDGSNDLDIGGHNTQDGNIIMRDRNGNIRARIDTDTANGHFKAIIPTTGNTGLCHVADGSFRRFVDCSSAPTDLAENFSAVDTTIEPGDLVVADGQAEVVPEPNTPGKITSKAAVKKTEGSYDDNILGIISTDPNQLYGDDGVFQPSENPVPVSMAGRVPTKVSLENGPIRTGDYITSSSTPGVGMKATRAGRVVGIALQDFTGGSGNNQFGKIVVFVNPTWYDPATKLNAAGDLSLAGLNGIYSVTNDADNITLDNSYAAKEMIAAYLKTGKLDTYDLKVAGKAEFTSLEVSNFKLAGKTLNQYIEDSVVTGQVFTSLDDQLTEQQTQINQLDLESNILSTSVASQSASLSTVTARLDQIEQATNDTEAVIASLQDRIASLETMFANNMSTNSAMLFTDSPSATVSANIARSITDTEVIFDKKLISEDDLTILGKLNTSDIGVTGTITSGLLTINGFNDEMATPSATISTLGGVLSLQHDGMSGIDFVAGKVAIDVNGNVLVREGDVEIENGDLVLRKGSIKGSNSIRGIDVPITAGATEVNVTFTDINDTDTYAISVLPTWFTNIIVQDKTIDGFKILFDRPAPADATIDWLIVE